PFVIRDCREPVLAIEIRLRCSLDKVRPVIFLLIFSFLVKCSSKILPPPRKPKCDFIVEEHLEVGTFNIGGIYEKFTEIVLITEECIICKKLNILINSC